MTDEEAWRRNHRFRWVYNKLEVAESQEVECGLVGVDPPPEMYPVCVRPVFNLWGGGIDACRAHDRAELEECSPGSLWTKWLDGLVTSMDIYKDKAFLVLKSCYVAHHLLGFVGAFDFWARTDPLDSQIEHALQWASNNLRDYDGWINLEMINEVITEVHLRSSDFTSHFEMPLWGWAYEEYSLPRVDPNQEAAWYTDPEEFYVNPPRLKRLGVVKSQSFAEGLSLRRSIAAGVHPALPTEVAEVMS